MALSEPQRKDERGSGARIDHERFRSSFIGVIVGA